MTSPWPLGVKDEYQNLGSRVQNILLNQPAGVVGFCVFFGTFDKRTPKGQCFAPTQGVDAASTAGQGHHQRGLQEPLRKMARTVKPMHRNWGGVIWGRLVTVAFTVNNISKFNFKCESSYVHQPCYRFPIIHSENFSFT